MSEQDIIMLNQIIDGINCIMQEQRNQRTQLDIIKAKLDQTNLNSKQRYEVLNARLNGAITLMKEITNHGKVQKRLFDAGNST